VKICVNPWLKRQVEASGQWTRGQSLRPSVSARELFAFIGVHWRKKIKPRIDANERESICLRIDQAQHNTLCTLRGDSAFCGKGSRAEPQGRRVKKMPENEKILSHGITRMNTDKKERN
jgi:hypothetical protein